MSYDNKKKLKIMDQFYNVVNFSGELIAIQEKTQLVNFHTKQALDNSLKLAKIEIKK